MLPGNLGAVAQLGERGLCKPEVVGSIPSGSTLSRRAARAARGTPRSASELAAPTSFGEVTNTLPQVL